MKIHKTKITAIILVCAILMSGCATTQEDQQAAGAVTGAVAGGLLTGLLTGNVGYGIAGAVAGAALGWGAVKMAQYDSQQVRSSSQDQQMYGLTPSSNSVLVKLNKGSASPETVSPGQQVSTYSDYSLALPSSQKEENVTETWVLKKDGKELFKSPQQQTQRAPGGYAVTAAIPIPKDAPSGTYVVETKVQAGTSYDTNQAIFIVK
jgi:hypothetical protein